MITEKDVGVIAVTKCAHKQPATPAKKAPKAKAIMRVLERGIPKHSAAISFSRIASMLRPNEECLTFQQTYIVMTTHR
ncbi:unnamed protein product [marine sediment metagenome]|uniref:Uncharacterized protein n=1 Tax=marine sediment metagenome TaxID=412755 RepID=X0U0J9_9ZZZZ